MKTPLIISVLGVLCLMMRDVVAAAVVAVVVVVIVVVVEGVCRVSRQGKWKFGV